MGRSLKFRTWDKDMKYMHVCGENVHDSMMFIDNIAYYYNLQNGCGSYGSDSSYILMQWTGLKDRNGIDVYEGDIVKRHKFGGNINMLVGTIEYRDDWAAFTFKTKNGYHELMGEFEVIGNIYQHPELMEGDFE